MKCRMSIIAVLVGATFIGVLWAQGSPDYVTQIEPILEANCSFCHGFVASYEKLMAKQSSEEATEGMSVVVPGDAAGSLLIWRLEGQTPDGTEIGRMPQGGALKPEEIRLIVDWIDAGALAEAPTPVGTRSWGQIKAGFRAP